MHKSCAQSLKRVHVFLVTFRAATTSGPMWVCRHARLLLAAVADWLCLKLHRRRRGAISSETGIYNKQMADIDERNTRGESSGSGASGARATYHLLATPNFSSRPKYSREKRRSRFRFVSCPLKTFVFLMAYGFPSSARLRVYLFITNNLLLQFFKLCLPTS